MNKWSAERALANCTNAENIKRGLKLTTNRQLMDVLTQNNPELKFTIPVSHQEAWRLVLINKKFHVIDEPMADVISRINRWGLVTKFCCCGGHSRELDDIKSLPIYYILFEKSAKADQLALELFNTLAAEQVKKSETEEYSLAASTNRIRSLQKERIGIAKEYSAYIDVVKIESDSYRDEKRTKIEVRYKLGYRERAIEELNYLIEKIGNDVQ